MSEAQVVHTKLDIEKAISQADLPTELIAALIQAYESGYRFANVVEGLAEHGYEMRIVSLEGDPNTVLARMLDVEPDDGDEYKGSMISLFPNPEVAEALASPDMPADEIHCTLAYLPGDRPDAATTRRIMDALAETCQGQSVLTGTLAGEARFTGDDPCQVALPDVPGLTNLRHRVVTALTAAGVTYSTKHDFTPHLTATRDLDNPVDIPNGMPVRFDHLRLCMGDTHFALPFNGDPGEAYDATKGQPDVGQVHVDTTGWKKKPAAKAVSTKPWGDITQADYTPAEWAQACLIDTKQGAEDSKARYKLPVREPDGTLNRYGCAAAASRIDQVDEPEGVKRAAALKLLALYRGPLDTPPPAGLLAMLGEKATAKAVYAPGKVDKEDARRYTLGPWYIPQEGDAHDEWTDPTTLQEALWGYVESGDREIRLQHNPAVIAGRWVEAVSWPYPVDTVLTLPDGGQNTVSLPGGTCYLGVIWEPWAWRLVLDGKILGLSIGGNAVRVDLPLEKAMGTAGTIPAVQQALGDTYAFSLAAQNAHWNVAGPDFAQYHGLFGEVYASAASAIDPLAEVLRQLGVSTPTAGVAAYAASLLGPSTVADPPSLTKDLARRNRALLDVLDGAFTAASNDNQQGVANLIAERIAAHQKWGWQLESSEG